MIDSNTKAPITGSSINNKQFTPTAENVPRKGIIIGTYDPTILTITDNVPAQLFSAEDAGAKYGFGSMLHRLAIQAFKGGNGVTMYANPQSEAGGAVAATGDLTLSGTTIGAGTYALYIAGIRVPVTVAAGDLPAAIAANVVTAVNANADLPVTALINVTPEIVDFTAKMKGPFGNGITITTNILSDDVNPTNLVTVVTDMASGAGIPDIQDALDGMGVGDNRNSEYWTGMCHGYGTDTTTLDAIAAWVGLGNTKTGLYDKLVHRPIRVMDGDVQDGSAGLAALIALGDGRKTDRANGILSVPGSETHSSEIGAFAMGYAEYTNNLNPTKNYEDAIMTDIRPGSSAVSDRFTDDHGNRDTLAKAGISTTQVKDGVVKIQNLLTYYHPTDVSPKTNSYADWQKISRLQNILKNQFDLGNRWKNKTIVDKAEQVTDSEARLDIVDAEIVKTDMVVLISKMIQKSWIRNKDFSNSSIVVIERTAGNGFDVTAKYILSGNAEVRDINGEVDSSIEITTTL
jgi:phage tail sheath gpL-like